MENLQGQLPVFYFHTLDTESFEEKLRFLKTNHYSTVTCDEAHEYLVEGRSLPQRSLMLTFDDGRRSLWTVGHPLLVKYGFTATSFIAPRVIDEQVLVPQEGPHGFPPAITWDEARTMHRSGVIDFQSHSLDHRRIPVSTRIVDFVHPELIDRYYFEFGIPLMNDAGESVSNLYEVLGAPVYESAPFLGEERMYREDIGLREECVRYAEHNGGMKFFRGRHWKHELRHLVRRHRGIARGRDSYETPEEQATRIRGSLERAKHMIEERLEGKRVRHLAYPWGAGSPVSVRMSRETGHITNFWISLPSRSRNRPGGDPFSLVRLKHDFIWRLPGEGRKSLREVLLQKITRRARGELDYSHTADRTHP
jgi:peptidoglycan/xylan/chitin deacetylase (PgdA/CDA1 family)